MSTKSCCVHATLVAHNEDAVLITGKPGTGKSSLALTLMHHGYKLVADDVVILTKRDSGLWGLSPRKTRGLLMAPELIDVRKSLGEDCFIPTAQLRFIYHLTEAQIGLHSQPQAPTIVYHQILGHSLPEYIKPVTPHLNQQERIADFMEAFALNMQVPCKQSDTKTLSVGGLACTY